MRNSPMDDAPLADQAAEKVRIRQALSRFDVNKSSLISHADVSARYLRNVESKEWNPPVEVLAALSVALDSLLGNGRGR